MTVLKLQYLIFFSISLFLFYRAHKKTVPFVSNGDQQVHRTYDPFVILNSECILCQESAWLYGIDNTIFNLRPPLDLNLPNISILGTRFIEKNKLIDQVRMFVTKRLSLYQNLKKLFQDFAEFFLKQKSFFFSFLVKI